MLWLIIALVIIVIIFKIASTRKTLHGDEAYHTRSLSAKEARAVLGVGDQAGADEVKEAYRRLVGRCHPDHGGTQYLAMLIIQARDRLL